jgi:NAD-dependent deacetylase
VIHLHGEILKARPADDRESVDESTVDGQGWPKFKASRIVPWTQDLNLGDVDEQGAQLRPHIVWFGEGLPDLDQAVEAGLADDVDVLIVVGTTLNVYPAASIATETRAKQVFVVDPNPPDLRLANLKFIQQPASVGIRQVVDELRSRT